MAKPQSFCPYSSPLPTHRQPNFSTLKVLASEFVCYPLASNIIVKNSSGMRLVMGASSEPRYSPPPGKQCKYTGQSVRALPIRIVTVGKKRSTGVQLIVEDYIQKLKHYCAVEDIRLKSNPKNAHDAMAQIEHEDTAMIGIIKSNEWVVMLDENGLDLGSEQMASVIGDAGNRGASSIVFCIGGPYGHGKQLRQRADVSVKLSSLVLNHEVALVVLVEQLYRAWTILKGQKYHH